MRKAATGAIPPRFRVWQIGGQVPDRDGIAALRLAQAKPKPYTAARLLEHTEPRLTVDGVLDGLGMDPAQYSSWRRTLQENRGASNELLFRRNVMTKAMAERLDPALRRALLQRSLNFYREFRKSIVEVIDLENAAELVKAEPKGGKYYRRVPREDGKGYRYYYDPTKYERSRSAHVDGSTAARNQIKAHVTKLLESEENQKSGIEIKSLKAMVQRYGSQACAEALKEMRADGGLDYKNGRLSLKKSHTFIAYV